MKIRYDLMDDDLLSVHAGEFVAIELADGALVVMKATNDNRTLLISSDQDLEPGRFGKALTVTPRPPKKEEDRGPT